MNLKTIRMALWGAVAVFGVGVGALYFAGSGSSLKTSASQIASIGGPFTMTDLAGETVTEADLKGRKHAIFFGFASCPDVCPITLQELTAAASQLDKNQAEDLDIIFVSVDHERDTPEYLSNYLSVFESDSRIRGFTGTKEQVAKMAKAYRVYYKKVTQDDGDYLYDHSASTFLFDDKGSFEGTIAFNEKPSVVLQKLKNLLAS